MKKAIVEMNTVEMLKEAGLTVAQVLKQLEYEKEHCGLTGNIKRSSAIRWFCARLILRKRYPNF